MSALEHGAHEQALDDEASQIFNQLESIGQGKTISRALVIALSQVVQTLGSNPELIAAELRSAGLA